MRPFIPESEVKRVYQPVEVRHDEDAWSLGRITAWWRHRGGQLWCQVRIVGSGTPAEWEPFAPERLVLLPTCGV